MNRRWKKIFVLTKEEANGAEELRLDTHRLLRHCQERNQRCSGRTGGAPRPLLIPMEPSPVDHVRMLQIMTSQITFLEPASDT